MRRISYAVISLCWFLSLCVTCMAVDGQHEHHHGGGATVISGTLSFSTSCAANEQRPFEQGVAALHSFEYEVAEQQFQAIEKQTPGCGMAYWGEAMSLWHQLWSRPSASELARGKAQLAKAAKTKLTPREREYVDALSKFYANPKEDHDARATAYSQAMEKVYRDNPKDTEAAVFYALSLLASAPDEDMTLKNNREAVTILNKVYVENPQHPGIAHYIIHSTDNPALAPMGLEAARRYAALAPESPHAVHMPSHIFARLGLWRDDITSNENAVKVANTMGHLHMEHHKMHSLDFLEYAYLQIGDDAAAKKQIDGLATIDRAMVPEEFKDYHDAMVAGFAMRYALERRQWREALALEPQTNAAPFVQAITYLAHAVAAGHTKDAAAAKAASEKIDALIEAQQKSDKAYYAKGMDTAQKEAQAWSQYAGGDTDAAITTLRAVADKQDKVGKGETEMPAREMLADMMLQAGRAQEALKEYQVALKTDPNRFNSLYGAAQAAKTANDHATARQYFAQLEKNCAGVQSDRAELKEVRDLVAAK